MNAREWLAAGPAPGTAARLLVLGAPVGRASISPTRAQATPGAFRDGLARFATFDGDHGVELSALPVQDLGDVEGDEADADCAPAHVRIRDAVSRAALTGATVCVIGGDNSLTLPAMLGAAGGGLAHDWGLLTFDAHHDVRPRDGGGPRNGTPVRDLVEAGLPGGRVAQVGLHGFANASEHVAWASEHGLVSRRAAEVRAAGMGPVLGDVLDALGRAGADRLYVDVDLDVLDRAFAPACPASMPGGLTPADLQEAAFLLGRDPRVRAVDLTEVDATADVGGTTVRTMASIFLAFCSGVALRRAGPPR